MHDNLILNKRSGVTHPDQCLCTSIFFLCTHERRIVSMLFLSVLSLYLSAFAFYPSVSLYFIQTCRVQSMVCELYSGKWYLSLDIHEHKPTNLFTYLLTLVGTTSFSALAPIFVCCLYDFTLFLLPVCFLRPPLEQVPVLSHAMTAFVFSLELPLELEVNQML